MKEKKADNNAAAIIPVQTALSSNRLKLKKRSPKLSLVVYFKNNQTVIKVIMG